VQQALDNAGSLMRQAGAQMVKLEGNGDQVEIVHALASSRVSRCVLTLVYSHNVCINLVDIEVQGREQALAEQMLDDAIALQQAGADLMLLECVPESLAKTITEKLPVPVIGIGAGSACDGQILVLYDILDISIGFRPKFSKNFIQHSGSIEGAVKAYVDAVKSGEFPSQEHSFH